jgi:hypothetical protein
MNDQLRTPWQGDWQLRLHAKLQSLGFTDLDAYLSANPGIGYVTLAESLGDADVAAMQLYGEQIRRAARQGCMRDAAADSLARFLAQHLRRGWGNGQHFWLRLASAFGDWKTVIRQFSEIEPAHDHLDAVTEAIKAVNPPHGWIPRSGSDAILQSAFAAAWPVES